jgi:hypothetical protein
MNNLWKKTIVIGILTLLFGMTLGPSISAASQQNERNDTTLVAQSNLNNGKLLEKMIFENYGLFQRDIQSFISDLKDPENNFKDLDDILDWLRNKSEYPLLTLLFTKMLNLDRLENRDIILSFGWSYDFNPMKKTDVKFLKPLSIWMYKETAEKLNVPSMTVLISGDPVAIETISGNQLGFMFRFRGIYGHIPRQFPQESFTYLIGSAQKAAAIEMPTMNMFAS